MADPFDSDDFEVDFDDDTSSHGGDVTVVRATFMRGGEIAMSLWMPGLAEGGPMGMHFRARERAGVAIADLQIVKGDPGYSEVIVEFMAGGHARQSAESALVRWARDVGHKRIWLPDGPVELDPQELPATAAVRCRVCRAIWTDSTPAFWDGVQSVGHFPLVCPTCAHALPQWRVAPGDATGCRGPARAGGVPSQVTCRS